MQSAAEILVYGTAVLVGDKKSDEEIFREVGETS